MNESTRFIQVHSLTSYCGVLLNRDDVGFAKRLSFGGKPRIRISSQCLKRHWRTFTGEHALIELEIPLSVRSRYTFEELIYKPLISDGLSVDLAHFITQAMMDLVLGKSEKAKKNEEGNGNGGAAITTLQTSQVTVLGRPEVSFILENARVIAKLPEIKPIIEALGDLPADEEEQKKALEKIQKDVKTIVSDNFSKTEKQNLQALQHASGLDTALFGRMVTSDVLSRADAAIHVAHSITTSAEEAEIDFFSVVDDLKPEGGSGHINQTELTSGIFYGYVVVDVPLLVSNLTACHPDDWLKADHSLAEQLLYNLVHMIATVTPGAKLGSTSPYAISHMVMVEMGRSQPRSLANSFLQPVSSNPHLLENSYKALVDHVTELDAMYGQPTFRNLKAIGQGAELLQTIRPFNEPALDSLQELANWINTRD